MPEDDETVNDVIDAIFSGDMSDMDEEDDMDEVVYEIEMEDEDMDEMEHMTNETYKPKGVGIGKPKFKYEKTTFSAYSKDVKS